MKQTFSLSLSFEELKFLLEILDTFYSRILDPDYLFESHDKPLFLSLMCKTESLYFDYTFGLDSVSVNEC